MILCCEVNTQFCRETGYVANTRFLAFFLLRFDSDKCDLTQTLLRYLDKKIADWGLCMKPLAWQPFQSAPCPGFA